MKIRINQGKLRETREGLHLSQRDLASRAGLDYSTVSKYELGKVNDRNLNIVRLAKALGCKVEDLVEIEEE